MTDTLLGHVAAHGPLLVLLVITLSSTGFPVPGSMTLLTAGSFAAAGEMHLGALFAAGLLGAVAGDQIGYWFGRRGGSHATDWARRRGMGASIDRARAFSVRWGDTGNFVCRWLVSPIAPAVNLLSGVMGIAWARFTLFSTLGEVVWVALYLGLGRLFGRYIDSIARLGGDIGLFLAAALGAFLLFRYLRGAARARGAAR